MMSKNDKKMTKKEVSKGGSKSDKKGYFSKSVKKCIFRGVKKCQKTVKKLRPKSRLLGGYRNDNF